MFEHIRTNCAQVTVAPTDRLFGDNSSRDELRKDGAHMDYCILQSYGFITKHNKSRKSTNVIVRTHVSIYIKINIDINTRTGVQYIFLGFS
jgi:hypothetical protein